MSNGSQAGEALDDKSHYEVMGLPLTASKAEVRARFLKLVRLHHPDKAGARCSSSSQVIHKLYTAHQVLSNDDSRAIYDAELAQRRDTSLSSTSHTARPPRVSATLDLDTFEPTDEEAIRFEHPCRCGANYIVSADDLMMEGFELVECSGCSEVVKVAWRDETDEDGRQGHE